METRAEGPDWDYKLTAGMFWRYLCLSDRCLYISGVWGGVTTGRVAGEGVGFRTIFVKTHLITKRTGIVV